MGRVFSRIRRRPRLTGTEYLAGVLRPFIVQSCVGSLPCELPSTGAGTTQCACKAQFAEQEDGFTAPVSQQSVSCPLGRFHLWETHHRATILMSSMLYCKSLELLLPVSFYAQHPGKHSPENIADLVHDCNVNSKSRCVIRCIITTVGHCLAHSWYSRSHDRCHLLQ